MTARREPAARPGGASSNDATRDDASLLRAVAAGDLGALGALYDRYNDDVRRFVVRASAGADADDLVHETFLALLTAARTYDPEGRATARPFLLGIAARLSSNRRRRIARWARAAVTLVTSSATEHARTPEDAASVDEEVAAFERALATLSEEKRVVFLLAEAEGLPGEEIAAALGIPTATVWTRLHYARAALRAAIAKERRP